MGLKTRVLPHHSPKIATWVVNVVKFVLILQVPFGRPPVLPDSQEQLEEHLLHPEKLEIHDVDRCQR